VLGLVSEWVLAYVWAWVWVWAWGDGSETVWGLAAGSGGACDGRVLGAVVSAGGWPSREEWAGSSGTGERCTEAGW
jgi:hypothetical protein